MSDVYKRLAVHLDNLPGGFPATDSGVEIRILKRLFTPEEAEIALGLTLMLETPSAIAERLKMNEESLASMLETMSKKGLIFSIQPDDGRPQGLSSSVHGQRAVHHPAKADGGDVTRFDAAGSQQFPR